MFRSGQDWTFMVTWKYNRNKGLCESGEKIPDYRGVKHYFYH